MSRAAASISSRVIVVAVDAEDWHANVVVVAVVVGYREVCWEVTALLTDDLQG